MALIDMEGGDHLTSGLFTTKLWTNNPRSVNAGRVRGESWELTNLSIAMTKTLPSTYSTVITGFGVQWHGMTPTAQETLLLLKTSAGATVMSLLTNVSGQLVVKNSGGTVIATGTTVLAPNTWYYVEVKLVVGTSGTVEVHLNGVSGEIASTTGNFGTTNVGQVALNAPASSGGLWFDDWYLLDSSGGGPQNTFLGDVTVETLYPNGDGTHQQWTPSAAGAHFSKVNESSGTYPDGDTTYVSDVTPGDIDSYTVGPLATLTGTVFGVVTNLYARKDDAAARTIAPVIREGGTDHVGTTTGGLTTSYLFYRQIYPLDPAGAAWTIGSVNGAEYGVKEVT